MDMKDIPFSVYDFFAYLSTGFLFLAALDYVVGEQLILKPDMDVPHGIFWVLAAYITGQIIATPSSWLLERNIVGKWLKRPSINLFRNKQEAKEFRWAKLFPGYFTPLPEAIQKKILEKANTHGITGTGEALFIHVFGIIKKYENYMARLNIFLNMYGFSRNISFTCLISAVVILAASIKEGSYDKLQWVFLALIGSAGMFYRYLKFFRQYSYEMFVTYAEMDDSTEGQPQ